MQSRVCGRLGEKSDVLQYSNPTRGVDAGSWGSPGRVAIMTKALQMKCLAIDARRLKLMSQLRL